MRSINMVMGILFILAGILMIFNEGMTFLSVAFILGILLMVAGLAEVKSFKSYRGDIENTTWILVDGMTTFILGFMIIMNKLSSDATVPLVLGLWVMITGIRNLVRTWENRENKGIYYYAHAVVGAVGLILGLYSYFNADIFMFTTGVQVGLCLLVQGANAFMVASTIIVVKPDFLKSKQELLAEAEQAAEKAARAAKDAIIRAKEAEQMVKVVENTPEAEFDLSLAPKPGTEEINHSGR